MSHDRIHVSKGCLKSALVSALLGCVWTATAPAQSPARESKSPSAAPQINAEQQLVEIESGFFEAWRTNDQGYFREHMAENGIFWGEDGTLSRDQQLASWQANAKNCTVQGFGLSDFGALALASGAYLVTYKAQQYGACNGEKLPVHINGSSIYIFRSGHWLAIYRAQVPVKNAS